MENYLVHFICILMIVYGGHNYPFPCPGATFCECDKENRSASCFNKNLNTIPQLPHYVTDFYFSENNIEHLNLSLLKPLENLKIKKLILTDNGIVNITSDAFSKLKYIKELDLSENPIKTEITVAESVIRIPSSDFSTIKLQEMMWNDEPIHLYKSLSKFKIIDIDLHGNNFKTLNITLLSEYFPQLELVNFGHGGISTILPGFHLNLKMLFLNKNYLDIISMRHGFIVNKTHCSFPNLERLDLSENLLSDFRGLFDCLKKLNYLFLDSNPIRILRNNTFASLPLLIHLSLSYIGTRIERIESYAFRSKTLKKLDISGNDFAFVKIKKKLYFDENNIFRCASTIQDLNLGGNLFDLMNTQIFKQMILPLYSLKRLVLNTCNFETLPTNIFYNLKNLEILSINYNMISSWNGQKVFGNRTILHTIYLNGNKIAVIDKTLFPVDALKNLSSIALIDNPFACTCENLWFFNWIRHQPEVFAGYPYLYNCKTPFEREGKLIKDYYPSDCDDLFKHILTSIVMCISVLGILFTVIVSIVYRMRWHIRYWIYLNKVKKSGFSVLSENNGSFSYDAFVIYCNEDAKWIYKNFVNRIEKEAGLKLCIHHRDFEAGKVIVENIIEKMSNSKKIILVVSREMVKSDWCLFETRVAQERFLNREADAVITIMLENIPKQEMASSLRSLVNSTTYIEWPRKEYEEENFWKEVLGIIHGN